MKQSRRTFLIRNFVVASAIGVSRETLAAASHLAESDPTAQALGYKENVSEVDSTKRANYVVGEQCSNCQFYQGKSGDLYASCVIFGSRQVHSTGWCFAYNRKV